MPLFPIPWSWLKQTVQNKHKQVAKLAAMLKHDNLRATCQAIWEFVYEHIQYKRDEAGKKIAAHGVVGPTEKQALIAIAIRYLSAAY